MDYEEMLKGYKVLSISEIRHEREDDVLFVIGNGFDLMMVQRQVIMILERRLVSIVI